VLLFLEGKVLLIRWTRETDMSLFSKFTRKEPLHDQAVRLVPAASILAVSSFAPLLDRHPILRETEVEDWDFFATTATVCVALNNLKAAVPTERFINIYAVFLPHLRKWHDRGEDAVLDCQEFVTRTVTTEVPAQDALGVWVLWNSLRRQPNQSEAAVGREIGRLLSTPLHDWWTQ
jgi:hypothetical protein